MEAKYDFFISYNKADTHWAEWIAWQLEEAGYTTRIQVWDFGAGSNFALEMHQVSIESAHTIAVLSPNFLKSEFCAPEWAAAFVQDPTGKKRKLLPVRVRECTPPGLLTGIDYIDLVGQEESAAKDELLSRIKNALQIVKGARGKPDSPPNFPKQLVKAGLSQPRFPGALPPIWKVPYNRNPNFTGRETELKFLREQLMSGSPAALTQAISGLGGVGKTQLSLEYIYRHAGDYDLVWWIRSEEPAILVADLAELATPMGLPQAELAEQGFKVKAVRQKLGQITGWLLVFDNASNPELLLPWLPQGSGGHIIITSRNDVWQRLAQKVPVKTLDRKESIKFLIKRTGQEDEASADILADELGDLPLAMEQAGAYMEETGRTLSDYLILFRSRRNDLLKSQAAPVDYPATVLTTWDLSMQQVEKESFEAIFLLNLFSFLSPDDIPRMLFAERNDRLPEPIAQVLSDPLLQDKAIASLKRYSLVELSGDAFSVHRLVQAVVREHLLAVQQESFCKAAVDLVAALMVLDTADPRRWPICGRLASHVLAVCEHAENLKIADEITADLLVALGVFFDSIAEYQNAKPVYEKALEINRRLLGEDHPGTATSFNNLGFLMYSMGEYEKARPCYEQALAIRCKVLGEEHPQTAQSLNNLGVLLQAMGEYAEARLYYEQALAIYRKKLGEEHRETATSLNNLGHLAYSMSEYMTARSYYEQAFAIFRKVLGEEHPDIAASLNNMGALLQAMGEYEAARPYHERALAIHRKMLGEEHPGTAASLSNIGVLLQAMGEYEAARPYHEQALAIRRKVLGEEHPSTVNALSNIGVLLQAMREYEAARLYHEQALEMSRKLHGEGHPDTATKLNNLGGLLREKGDYTAARPYHEQTLKIFRKMLGEEHPHTATALNNLGALLCEMGNLTASRPYYEKALEIRRKILGDFHPDTAASLSNLGDLLRAMGDYIAARPYLEQALAISRKLHGEEHPDTAVILNNLATLGFYEGNLREAEGFMNRAVIIREKVLGSQHPDTESARQNLEKIKQKMQQK